MQKVICPVPLLIDSLPTHVVQREFLSPNECISLCHWAEQTGYSRDNQTQHGEYGKISVDVIEAPIAKYPDIYERATCIGAQINHQYWRLALTGVTAPFEILRYRESDFIRPHVDSDYRKADSTKMTVVVQLVGRQQFAGGSLILAETDHVSMDIGDAVFFPSHLMHQVERVTQGVRIVLIGWIDGPLLV